MWWQVLYLFLVILCVNDFFYFGWWWHIEGQFNIADVGNALVWIGAVVMLIRRNNKEVLRNRFSILIVLYLGFLFIQIALSMLYYDQPLSQAIIATRHQFYIASFFLFLLLLDSAFKIRRVLNTLTFLSVIALLLGVVNYFGPTILSYKWVAHDIRSGITRAYIPGMAILSLAAIWEFSKWISKPQNNILSGFCFFCLLGGHFFRQTRMSILGLIIVVFGLLIVTRRIKLLIFCLCISTGAVALCELSLPENIILSPFVTTIQNVRQTSGTWKERTEQMKVDFEQFLKHPVIGSGATSLRKALYQATTRTPREAKLYQIAYKADLGYVHWLKAYGVIGIVWLLLFFWFFWNGSWRLMRQKNDENRDIKLFLLGYATFIVITCVTLNYMMYASRIVMVCLLAAIIIRTERFSSNAQK